MVKVLELNEKSLKLLGYHSSGPDDTVSLSFSAYRNFAAILFTFTSSLVFVLKNWPRMELVADPCFIVFGSSIMWGLFMNVGFHMENIMTLHFDLQKIVDKTDKDSEAYKIYQNTEEKCQQVTKILACYPLMTIFAAALFYSFYCMFIGNFDTSTWILPYTVSVPFSTKEIWKWYILWFLQTNMGFTYSLSTVISSAHFVCSCFYIGAICNHFNLLIEYIQKDVLLYEEEKNRVKCQYLRKNITKTLTQAVKLHVKAFEYVASEHIEYFRNLQFKYLLKLFFSLNYSLFSVYLI